MGNSPDPDEYEWSAASIVRGVIGGTWTFTDVPGAPDKTPDYRVDFADGRCAATEVTSSSRGEVLALHRSIAKEDWDASGLTLSWAISIPHELVSMPGLRSNLRPALAVLEVEGLAGYNAHTNMDVLSGAAAGAIGMLRALKVQAASSVPKMPGGSAQIMVGASGPADWATPDDVNAVVEHESGENAEKLAQSGADEGHIFIWIDPSNPGPSVPMFLTLPPTTTPALPNGVDIAWVATVSRPSEKVGTWAGSLWRVQRGGAWEVLSVPARQVRP